jgi:hypothetical protein
MGKMVSHGLTRIITDNFSISIYEVQALSKPTRHHQKNND